MVQKRRRILAAAVALAAAAWAGVVVQAQSPRVIAVEARKFAFLPARIELRRGEPVTLEFTSPEVVMGFFVPELKLRTDIVPGRVARLTFTPERTGSFAFLCDIFCGEGHEGMSGELVVS